MICYAVSLGPTAYKKAYEIQKRIHQRRVRREIPDVVLLLEHYPVITFGKSGKLENLLTPIERLRSEGISLFFTDRGGDVTYHGPGQLVFYPIVDLKGYGKDIRRFLYLLEEAFIKTLYDFSIEATRDDTHRGVYVDLRQIVAIGIAVKRWVTMHGACLNVANDLRAFSFINPCGLRGLKVTSMEVLLGHPVEIESVKEKLLRHFSSIFGLCLEERYLSEVI